MKHWYMVVMCVCIIVRVKQMRITNYVVPAGSGNTSACVRQGDTGIVRDLCDFSHFIYRQSVGDEKWPNGCLQALLPARRDSLQKKAFPFPNKFIVLTKQKTALLTWRTQRERHRPQCQHSQ